MQKKGFTLLEILIVTVIIGVLIGIGLPNFRLRREEVLDREAQANLRLIAAAERIWRMESDNNQYIPCLGVGVVGTQAVNNNLRLAIPTANPNWNYNVFVSVVDGVPSFCAEATRTAADGRIWTILSPTAADPDPLITHDACQ